MDVMPKKIVKHVHKVEEPEEIEVEKTPILKSEEVVETAPEIPVSEVSAVSQLAQVVEPEKSVVVEPQVVQVENKETMDISEKPEIVEVTKKKRSMWPLWVLIAFLLGAGAGFGLSKFSFEKVVEVKNINKVEPTSEPTAVVTKMPEKKFERESIKIKVLNGSGVRGKAGIMAEKLESLGYKDIETDNADRNDYAINEVSIKGSLKTFESEIKKDLGFAGEATVLASDDAFDVLMIIGQK